MRHTIAFGSKRIDFDLSFSPRKRLSISVDPGGAVVVKAPQGAALDVVLNHVQRRAGWITRQRDRFESFGPVLLPKRYVSGETHRYLGRQYRLNLSTGSLRAVKLVGRYFEIVTPDKTDSAVVRRQLDAWYRNHAEKVFDDRMRRCLRSSYLRKVGRPGFVIRRMKRRWGSCTKQGKVLLNPDLVKTPPDCIEYVITHELCHLIEHNHGPAYYRLLTKVMPDWERRWERLNSCEL